MQRKLTWILVTAAVALFAFIVAFERKIPGTAERLQPARLFPNVTVDSIRALQITFGPGGTVRAEKTNGNWSLTRPFYPARQTALDTFVTNLVELRKFDRIPAHEVALQGQKSFGLEPPRATVEIEFQTNRLRFEIGGTAPLTNNIYLRLPSGEVIVADALLLEALPRTTNDWRDPALTQLSGLGFDHLQVSFGQRMFELARVPTNEQWQITRPIPARADQSRVLELFELLRGAEASEFVTDSPTADLERFGLQNPEVQLTFAAGTNRLYTIEFGNSPTNHTNQIFARLLGQTNVVVAPKNIADFLKQPYKNFHDPRLATLNPPALDRIVVRSSETFSAQREASGSWIIDDPKKVPVDRELLARAIGVIASMQILDIVKEVPSDADLKAVGLFPAIASYAFFEKSTNAAGIATNILFTEVLFGGAQRDRIYVRRSDENPVYTTELGLMLKLPRRTFELRDRTLWRFASTNVLNITFSNSTETNTLVRSPGGWLQDPIVNAAIEEAVFRLGRLDAQDWTEKGRERLATFGINERSTTMRVEVRGPSGPEQHMLHFGRPTLGRDIYGSAVLPGDTEPTIFEFPGDLYHMISQTLPIPK